jgi:hypothetical protein
MMLSAPIATEFTTVMGDADVIITHRYYDAWSHLSIKQWHVPHREGPRRLYINRNADTCNKKDSIGGDSNGLFTEQAQVCR